MASSDTVVTCLITADDFQCGVAGSVQDVWSVQAATPDVAVLFMETIQGGEKKKRYIPLPLVLYASV